MKDIAITKLINEIVTIVENAGVSEDITNDVSNQVAVNEVIAGVIASSLDIPANKTNPDVYYSTKHLDKVVGLLNLVNENYIIDTDTALNLTKDFWTARYYTVYPANFDIEGLLNSVVNCKCAFVSPDFNKTATRLSAKLNTIDKQELNRTAGLLLNYIGGETNE